MPQKTESRKLNNHESDYVREVLESMGWGSEIDKNQYVEWRMVNISGAVAVMYTSGKLVIQGKENLVNEVLDQALGSEKLKDDDVSSIGLSEADLIVGCDEAGKGEFFGPLVLAACYIPIEMRDEIVGLGVDDSKKLTDDKIITIVEKLQEKVLFELNIVNPGRLNQRWRKIKNISEIMAQEYAVIIKKVSNEIGDFKKQGAIVVDRFTKISSRMEKSLDEVGISMGGDGVKCVQIPNGERYLSVAVASVLARAKYLEVMNDYELEYERKFPRGYSGVVEFSEKFIEDFGSEVFQSVAKTFFKTSDAVRNYKS